MTYAARATSRSSAFPRIGCMSGAEPSLISSFEDEMHKLGYSAGKNIHIEMRLSRMNTNDSVAPRG